MKRFILGLTGPIGSGKSTAARILAQLGATVLDADSTVHWLYSHDDNCRKALTKAFGANIIKEGAVDRFVLSKRVFGDAAALKQLNSIVHPLVLNRFIKSSQEAEGLVVWDVPLLIESGMTEFCNANAVVLTDRELRIERLIKSRGMSRADIESRMAAQTDDYTRLKHASYICFNNSNEQELMNCLNKITLDITRKMNE